MILISCRSTPHPFLFLWAWGYSFLPLASTFRIDRKTSARQGYTHPLCALDRTILLFTDSCFLLNLIDYRRQNRLTTGLHLRCYANIQTFLLTKNAWHLESYNFMQFSQSVHRCICNCLDIAQRKTFFQ